MEHYSDVPEYISDILNNARTHKSKLFKRMKQVRNNSKSNTEIEDDLKVKVDGTFKEWVMKFWSESTQKEVKKKV